MTVLDAVCVKGLPTPKLKGRQPKYACKRCGLVARKKKQLCKAKKLKAT